MTETRRHDYESFYKPPRAVLGVPGLFRARVWHRVVLLLFFGGSAAFLMVMGLLYLTPLAPPGLGPAEARMPGVVFTVCGLVFGASAFFVGVQVVARRGPAVRACREGLEVRVIGPSTTYGVPSAPDLLQLAGAVFSGQPCRLPTARVAWPALAGVSVTGEGEVLERVLVVQWRPEPAGEVSSVTLSQSEIAPPVGEVAGALLALLGDENARASLPGWGDPA